MDKYEIPKQRTHLTMSDIEIENFYRFEEKSKQDYNVEQKE